MSRKRVEDFTNILQINDINALAYHAGLDKKVRSKNQEYFLMHDCDIIVATIAFGMGIDKPSRSSKSLSTPSPWSIEFY